MNKTHFVVCDAQGLTEALPHRFPPKFCMYVTFVHSISISISTLLLHPQHAIVLFQAWHITKREREETTAAFHFECPPLTTCVVLIDGCRSSSPSHACEQNCTLQLIGYINQKQSLVVFKKCARCQLDGAQRSRFPIPLLHNVI